MIDVLAFAPAVVAGWVIASALGLGAGAVLVGKGVQKAEGAIDQVGDTAKEIADAVSTTTNAALKVAAVGASIWVASKVLK